MKVSWKQIEPEMILQGQYFTIKGGDQRAY